MASDKRCGFGMTAAKKTLSAIVAVDRRGAIGCRGELLCRLPDDLRRFKQLTTGHSIVMGRKTFESLPKGALPGRENIVITRNRTFGAPGVVVAHSVEDAIELASLEGEVFVIGGAQIYRAALDRVDTLHLTLIEHTFDDADVFFPPILPSEWEEESREQHAADERHPYPFAFITLRRVNNVAK